MNLLWIRSVRESWEARQHPSLVLPLSLFADSFELLVERHPRNLVQPSKILDKTRVNAHRTHRNTLRMHFYSTKPELEFVTIIDSRGISVRFGKVI